MKEYKKSTTRTIRELVKKKKEIEAEHLKVIEQMAGDDGVFIIDCVRDTRRTLHDNLNGAKKYTDEDNYSESVAKYVENCVSEIDREMMREATSAKYMLKRLKKEQEFTVTYRDITTGSQLYYEMRVAKLSDSEVLQSFKEKDKENIESAILHKLEDDYFAMLVIDLDAGMVRTFKDDLGRFSEVSDKAIPYAPAMGKFIKGLDGETRKFFEMISNVEFLKKRFKQEGKATHVYLSHAETGQRWVNTTGFVLTRHADGTPSLFVLGFNLLDEAAVETQEAQSKVRKMQEDLARRVAISDYFIGTYETSAYCNIKDGNSTIMYLHPSFGNFFDDKPISFFDSLPMYINTFVHPDDRDMMTNFFEPEFIRNQLKDSAEFTFEYRDIGPGTPSINRCAIIRGEDDDHVGIYFKDIGEEKKVENEREEKLRLFEESQKFIDNYASSYNIVLVINMADDSLEIRRMDENMAESGQHFANFTELKNYSIENVMHPRYKEKMRAELDFANIRKKLAETSSYNVEYIILKNGLTIAGEMNITSLGQDKIILGMVESDLELFKRRLEEKKYAEYIALFLVDLDTEMIRVAKASPLFKTAGVGEAVPYEPAMRSFAAIYEGEARQFINEISDLNLVRHELAFEDKRTFSYKAKNTATDTWIEVTSFVIERHEDGTPAMFSLGFSVVDTKSAEIQEIKSKLTSDMQMISGLASGYETLYYVNLDECVVKVYSLDGQKYPEAKQISDGGGDPFILIKKYGESELVHPDDRELFMELSADNVRQRLAHSKKFTIRFRRSFENNYAWSEMDVQKYEDIDERANVIAVGFANRDAEIRSEQAMNKCFAVLGEDITPQKAIDKMLSVTGEFYGAERCYIFETDLNKGITINTFEWCAEGIEAMLPLLQNVPLKELEGWEREFKRQGAFYMDALDSEHNTEEGREILEMQGIQSLIAAPIVNNEEIVGFVGVDNPTKAKTNIAVLKNVAAVAYSEILKRKQSDEEHVTLEKLTDTFMSVYYTDLTRDYMHTWKIDSDYKDAYGDVQSYSASMGGYVRKNIAERDRERCIEMTRPTYVLDQFRTKERFSIEMTDIMLGYERDFVFDYVKVNEDGTQFVVCCRDVTDNLAKEKAQQKQLQDALEAADSANKSKTNFLFNMSHDIRTPMNAITGFTTMAKKYADDKEKVLDYLEKIDISGQQLLTLINQVLEMARIESGKVVFNEEPINIQDRFNSMITVLSEQANTNGLHFQYALKDIKHWNVFADTARMSSITLNIVGNAMKYTPEGGTIEFTLAEIPSVRNGYATYTFTVKDTGIGMSEAFQKVLFEPFTRENTSTVSKIQGTGLGMPIVKNLVDLMGGNIEVHSELGKGTRFDVTVDFKINNAVKSESEKQHETKLITFKGCIILLVEDNEMNREIANDILNEYGFSVEEAEDGDIAVDKVKKHFEKGEYNYYDFILMDVQMPRMDGYEATRQIRALPVPDGVHVPIIAMTANAFEEDRRNAFAAGMDDHLAKPIIIKNLLDSMRKLKQ